MLSYIGDEALKAIKDLVLQHGGKAVDLGAGLLKPQTDDDLIAQLNSAEAKNPKAHNSVISDKPHGVFFGKQYGRYVIKPEEMDGHVMVIGTPGSGKSSCIAIPTLRNWQGSVFAIDIKGELYANTHKHRQNIKVFSPQNEDAPFGYNPYFFLEHSDNKAQEARAIAQSIISLPPNIKDTFWIESAQTILTGAILHYHYCGCTFIRTLEEILDQEAKALLKIIADSGEIKAARCVRNCVNMDDKTMMSIFPHMTNAIEAIVNNDKLVAALSKENAVTPEDLENGQDVYIQIPAELLSQWKSLVTLIVNQFITFFKKRKEEDKNNPQKGKNRPILMLLDEFPMLGKIPDIVTDALPILRSKQITVCLIAQSLAQLELIYGRTARKVIADTCAFKAVLGATDAETQKYFAQLVGTYEKLKNQRSKSFNPINVQSGSGVQSSFEDNRPIIKPEEFASLTDIVLLYPLPFNFCRVQKQPYWRNVNKP